MSLNSAVTTAIRELPDQELAGIFCARASSEQLARVARALSDEALGALVRAHGTAEELGSLLARALHATSPTLRAQAATEPPPSGERRALNGIEEQVLAAVRTAGGAGAKVSEIASSIDREVSNARYLCAKLVREGRLTAHGVTSTRVYRVAA